MPARANLWFDLIALLCGALLPLAFAPLAFYPLAILLPLAMFLVWQDSAPSLAFRRGYLFGLGMFGVGVSWVYIAISDFGFTSAPIAFLLTAIFVAFLALFPALQGYLSQWLNSRLRQAWHAPVYVLLWLGFEWIRGWFMTGFPWLNLGYAFIDAPLAGFAPILGVYGLSLLALISAALLWSLWQYRSGASPTRTGLHLGLLFLIWAAALLLKPVAWTQPLARPLKVAMIQANLPQITKWDPEQILYRMHTYETLSEPLWGKVDLIVWPENALTILWQDAPKNYQHRLQQRASETNTTLVIGVPYGDIETEYHSSMLVLGNSHGLYHKRHLVPFGEYVPLPDFMKKLAGFFDLPMSGFSPGAEHQPPLHIAGQDMAPSLCYEDAFGEQLIDFLPKSTVLINGSNNAWYGHSWAAAQHLQIARMRALETGRQSIRATTTGISALIDQRGHFITRSKQHVRAIVQGAIQPYKGATPYVKWGNIPVLIILLGGVLLFILQVVKLRRDERSG